MCVHLFFPLFSSMCAIGQPNDVTESVNFFSRRRVQSVGWLDGGSWPLVSCTVGFNPCVLCSISWEDDVMCGVVLVQ